MKCHNKYFCDGYHEGALRNCDLLSYTEVIDCKFRKNYNRHNKALNQELFTFITFILREPGEWWQAFKKKAKNQ
jgi:hypothetical protein